MMLKSKSEFNYIEILLVKNKINPYVYDIDFSESECGLIIQNIMNKFQKNFFKKHTTKHLFETLEMTTCNTENTTSVHNLLMVDNDFMEQNESSYLINYYDKNLLPNHNFPSTDSIHDIVDSKRLSMKITNNVYINVDSLLHEDKSLIRHVYINVNVKKASDISHINDIVKDIIPCLCL
jgi:hypothetical protein